MAYGKEVMDHFHKPRNVGELDEAKKNVGVAVVGAPQCGDVILFSIEVDDNDMIVDAKFKAFGCGSAIASSSYLTEQVKGKNLTQAMEVKNKDIAQALALPPVKWHCSVLAEDAIKSAIENYKSKQDSSKEAVAG
jgi:nitrogen fixation NifU-like protein